MMAALPQHTGALVPVTFVAGGAASPTASTPLALRAPATCRFCAGLPFDAATATVVVVSLRSACFYTGASRDRAGAATDALHHGDRRSLGGWGWQRRKRCGRCAEKVHGVNIDRSDLQAAREMLREPRGARLVFTLPVEASARHGG